jgi:hypothetical protein
MNAILLTALLLAADPSAQVAAQRAVERAGEPDIERTRREEVARLAPAKAQRMEVLVGDQNATEGEFTKANLVKDPLLRWSNPTAGSVHGEVFVWTADGRPAALASIFRWYHPFHGATVEIVSLSPAAVMARENGSVLWDSGSPGVSFASIDGPEPAGTKSGRLTQMRSLVRRFSAQLTDKRSGEAVVRDLRLMNQPMHRYDSEGNGIVDGGIFAIAEVTDPEAIVLIEAARSGGKTGWRYALARMNNHELAVRLDDAVVRTWPHIDKPWADRKSSYTLFSFEPENLPAKSP